MVGKNSSIISDRRISQDSNQSIRNSQELNNGGSFEESNHSSFQTNRLNQDSFNQLPIITDEDSMDSLGINILPEHINQNKQQYEKNNVNEISNDTTVDQIENVIMEEENIKTKKIEIDSGNNMNGNTSEKLNKNDIQMNETSDKSGDNNIQTKKHMNNKNNNEMQIDERTSFHNINLNNIQKSNKNENKSEEINMADDISITTYRNTSPRKSQIFKYPLSNTDCNEKINGININSNEITNDNIIKENQINNSPNLIQLKFPTESIVQIENSPPNIKKSVKRNSSVDLDKLAINKKKKSFLFENNISYFDNLSDEILLYIFSYLNKNNLIECAQVNKKWRRIIYDDSLWLRIDVSGRLLNHLTICSLLERNPKIFRMHYTEFQNDIHRINKILKTEYLDLSMCKINKNNLKVFLSHFKYLKKLSLEYIEVDIGVCKSIIQNDKLSVLNLSMTRGICEHFLEMLLKNCTNITQLNLAWTNLNNKCLDVLINNLNINLTHLNLSGCLKALNNSHIELLGHQCKYIIELDLSDCTQLTSDVIDIVIKYFQQLEILSISRCYNIAPNKYSVLMASKLNIQMFNIFGLLHNKQIEILQKNYHTVHINKNKFSIIARPTVGDKRTSIWGQRVRDVKDK